MPLGPMMVTSFVTPGTPQQEWFVENSELITKKYGVASPEDVLTMQYEAYLNGTSESLANKRAATVIA
jgi:hypothetical protein